MASLYSLPSSLSTAHKRQESSLSLPQHQQLAGHNFKPLTVSPAQRVAPHALTFPDSAAQTTAVATAVSKEAATHLHPNAVARRQQAQRRQQERNQIVSLRRRMKDEGKSWWQTSDSGNCFTVWTLNDYERQLTAAKHNGQLAVCLFFAPWCLACRALHPKVEQLAEQNPDVMFIKTNVEKLQELARSLSVGSLPSFIFYKGPGDPISQFTASLQPNRLAKLRAEIALHKA